MNGYKVRKVRELKGYTQEYMAHRLGIKQNTYCRKETGEIKISDEELEKIAKILDVTVSFIKSFSEDNLLKSESE